MASIINTNIASLNAQRNLAASQTSLSTSMQRLSSGLRINSAKDDAAGLAITERFTTQIRGLNQAARNANDGISLAQTAEGALAELSSNLQRIRELAVQSANSTNSVSDRAALDQEVQQRLAEIDRVSTQTSFNGLKLLDGSFGNSTFQVGANVGDTIALSLNTSMRTAAMGQIARSDSTTEVDINNVSGTGTIQVGSGAATQINLATQGLAPGQSVGSAFAKAAAINAAGVSGLAASATNNVQFGIGATTGAAAFSLRINGQDIFAGFDQAANGALSSQQITDGINAQTGNTGVTASLSGTVVRLSAADGRDINIAQVGGGTGGVTNGSGGPTPFNGVDFRDGTLTAILTDADAYSIVPGAVNGGTINLAASENIIITGDGLALGFSAANTTIAKDTTTLASVNVRTIAASNDALQRVDASLTAVAGLRSTFGAIQNRFESVIANLTTTSENLTASRSRIQDADFAMETANLSRAQILQQAGTAMVAQANQLPQGVLALLRQ